MKSLIIKFIDIDIQKVNHFMKQIIRNNNRLKS
jgi:hypothetical protein